MSSGNRIECCCPADAAADDRISRGLQWLGKKLLGDAQSRLHRHDWLYYLYGLERVGRLTAQRFIPLFPDPANPAAPTGIAKGPTSWFATRTAVGLLEGHGRRPAVRSRDRHQLRPAVSLEGTPAGAAGQARTPARRRLEPAPQRRGQPDPLRRIAMEARPDLAGAPICGWPRSRICLQAPVLYLCGSQDPVPEGPAERKELAQKLRDYLDRGGFLFAEAYCGGERRQFDRGFRQLMTQVVSRARVQAAAAGAGASDLARRGEDRPGPDASAAGGSSSAAAPAWSTLRPTRRTTRGRRCRASGNCRGRDAARSTTVRSRHRSTPRCRWASTCWPTPPIGN